MDEYHFVGMDVQVYKDCSKCTTCGTNEFGDRVALPTIGCTQITCEYNFPGGGPADTYTLRSPALDDTQFAYIPPCVIVEPPLGFPMELFCASGWASNILNEFGVTYYCDLEAPILQAAQSQSNHASCSIDSDSSYPYQQQSDKLWLDCDTLTDASQINAGCSLPWTRSNEAVARISYDRIAVCPTVLRCNSATNVWESLTGDEWAMWTWISTLVDIGETKCNEVHDPDSTGAVWLTTETTVSVTTGVVVNADYPECTYAIDYKVGLKTEQSLIIMRPNTPIVNPAVEYGPPLRNPWWRALRVEGGSVTYRCGVDTDYTDTSTGVAIGPAANQCRCSWFRASPPDPIADGASYACCQTDLDINPQCVSETTSTYVRTSCPPASFLRCSDASGRRTYTTATFGSAWQYSSDVGPLSSRCTIDPNDMEFVGISLKRVQPGTPGATVPISTFDASVLESVTCTYQSEDGDLVVDIGVGGVLGYAGPAENLPGWNNNIYTCNDDDVVGCAIAFVDTNPVADVPPDTDWLDCITASPGLECLNAPYADSADLRPPTGADYSSCPDPIDLICGSATQGVSFTIYTQAGNWDCDGIVSTTNPSFTCADVGRTNVVSSRATFTRTVATGEVTSWDTLECQYAIVLVDDAGNEETDSTTCTFIGGSGAPSSRYYAPVRTWGWKPSTADPVDATSTTYTLDCDFSAIPPPDSTSTTAESLCQCGFAIRSSVAAGDPWEGCCTGDNQQNVDSTKCLGDPSNTPIVVFPAPSPSPSPTPAPPPPTIGFSGFDEENSLYWLFTLVLVVPVVYFSFDILKTAAIQSRQRQEDETRDS